jgi:actin-related protein
MERGTQLDMHDTRVMKESMSYVRTTDSAPASETIRYELPDGREVETDGTILSEATEKLVCNTSVVPEGLAAQLFEAVKLCDDTLRCDLASNIVLAGGSSLCKGLGNRLQEDLTRSFAADAVLAECDVKVHPSKVFPYLYHQPTTNYDPHLTL